MSQQDLYGYVMNSPYNTNPAILKQKIEEISGASSWNDLKDRPFYEEMVEVISPTLVWDGSLNNRVVIDIGDGSGLVKISDSIFTPEDAAKGGTITVETNSGATNSRAYTGEEYSTMFGLGLFCDYIVVVTEDNTGKIIDKENFPVTFSESGMYVIYGAGISHLTMTANEYEGFRYSKSITHIIDTKYLPENTRTVVGYYKLIQGGVYVLTDDGANLNEIKRGIQNGYRVYLCREKNVSPVNRLEYLNTETLTADDGSTYDVAVFVGLGYYFGTDGVVAENARLTLNGAKAGRISGTFHELYESTDYV